ncbi:MAG: ferrous iron transport protein A [Ruminococcus sp.]|nr:ferrous iron transport protein A [Ruminococcus sp.]MDE6672182.1 ferrous iron transport protein A [Ruminococcus sp.]MDE6797871.1 ferrous iron transport protein A [Ruminococcus sp.]
MKNIVGMDNLKENQTGQVEKILLDGKIRNRLNDLGLIKGTYIECLYRNKGISAYMIRGTVIAIRTEDTSQIKIIIPES